MTTLIFYALSSIAILGLIMMIVTRPTYGVLISWVFVSFVLAILFFLLCSPFVATLQLLLTVCLGCSFLLAIRRSPKTKTRPLSVASIVIVLLSSLICLVLLLIISIRLWSLTHTEFPNMREGTHIQLTLEQLLTGHNQILVFGTALLILSGLVSLVTLTRKEKT